MLSSSKLIFDAAFDRLIGNEGGYVDRPDDPGGETSWGITWPVLHQAIAQSIVPPETTIATLTREQARPIYRAIFWDRARMDEFDPAVAFQTFDIAVNSGIETGVRLLQRAAGMAEDGHIGPVTIAAVRAMPVAKLLMLLIAERIDFWRKLSVWPKFGNGWAGRAAKDLRYAAQDFGAPPYGKPA